MALTTYTELKESVYDWLKRNALTGVVSAGELVPDCITIGEAELFRRLRVRAMESAISILSTVAGTATVALPANFRAFKWLYVDGDPKRKLDVSSGEQIFLTYAGAVTSKPVLYALTGDNLLLGPTPDSNYTLYYTAYIAPTALSGSTATNTLFPRYADLYLFAALKAAFNLLEDDAQVQKYSALLTAGINDAKIEDEMDRHSGSTMAVRPAMRTP